MFRKLWKSYRFPMILLISIFIGCIIGIIFGKSAMNLKPLGTIFINLLFTHLFNFGFDFFQITTS